MLKVAVIGAGAGGVAAVAQLTLAGHEVRLWNRSAASLAPLRAEGGVAYEGVLGDGFARPLLITDNLAMATAGADVALVCLPTFSHTDVARGLVACGAAGLPVILNPGHTGGALETRQAFIDAGAVPPPIAEFSTLTYVARKYTPTKVTITGAARKIKLAALPGGQVALQAACELFPASDPVGDVLACDLANINMVVHPPGAVLGAAWVEARRGDFTFYVDGMTPGVARVMQQLDDERRAVAQAFGHELPSVIGEMQAIGTVDSSLADPLDLAAAIASGEANRRIKAPDSLNHRYYSEDFGHGLLPFIDLAAIASVPAPCAEALFSLGQMLTGTDYRASGRTAVRMGIKGLDRDALLALVRG